MHPLNSIKGAITAGVLLAIALSSWLTAWSGMGVALHMGHIDRWLHIVAGVMWIGLLWYFNVVQTPGLAAAAADKGGPGGAGIAKYIAPRALLWFRWAAVATWVTGAWYLTRTLNFTNALTLGHGGKDQYGLIIGIGAWLGTIMLFNVWVFIWPNQKKILGIGPGSGGEKARARKTAAMASRTNFVLSIPVILCMGSAFHGMPF